MGRGAGGGVGGVPVLPPVGPSCAWRGAAVSGSVCRFRVCSCMLGHCALSVGNAPLLFGCSAPYRVHRHITGAVPRIGCSAPVLVAAVAAVGVVGVFWACVVFCLGHFVVPLWRLMLWFLRNVACNSPTRISNIEIAPLELQRFRALQKVRVPELHASFG